MFMVNETHRDQNGASNVRVRVLAVGYGVQAVLGATVSDIHCREIELPFWCTDCEGGRALAMHVTATSAMLLDV